MQPELCLSIHPHQNHRGFLSCHLPTLHHYCHLHVLNSTQNITSAPKVLLKPILILQLELVLSPLWVHQLGPVRENGEGVRRDLACNVFKLLTTFTKGSALGHGQETDRHPSVLLLRLLLRQSSRMIAIIPYIQAGQQRLEVRLERGQG